MDLGYLSTSRRVYSVLVDGELWLSVPKPECGMMAPSSVLLLTFQ